MRSEGLAAANRYRVGDLEVEVGLQRVVRGGIEIPLPKLSFDLLVVLVRAAPNLVSHAELLARVWPGLVVTEKTVSQRIKLLRDALGDDAEEPRYVVSSRGRGYRIAAPVVALEPSPSPPLTAARAELPAEHTAIPAAATPAALAVPRAGPPRGARLAGALGLVALALVAAIGLGVRWHDASTRTSEPSVPATAAPARTVAVLPFRVAPGGDANAFIGTGIAEAVLERLGKIAGIDTIARGSAFGLVNGELAERDIAARLGARYLVSGSIERAGEELRVSARLTDAASGAELWADTFDRPTAAIFDVQEEIARRAAAALRSPESPAEAAQRRARLTSNVEAYLAYLRGRALLGRWTVVDARKAESEFAAALELDPDFAAAYASLYEARLLAADRAGGGSSPNTARAFLGEQPLAKIRRDNQALVDRAVALDPLCGAAYFARAIWADSDTPERGRDFERGLELDPSNGRGITAYAEYLGRLGRRDEAERILTRAIAVDPLSPRAHFVRVTRDFPADASRLESGMREVLKLDPEYQPALQRYAKYRWQFHGEMAEGVQILERGLELDPGNPWLTHTAVAMYLDLGEVAAARERLAAAERRDVAGDLLLAVYDGDVATAGAAAYEDAAFASGRYEAWGVVEAVRDEALRSHDAARAVDYLERRYKLLDSAGRVADDNFRAVPAMAELLLALGRRDEARALLSTTIQWIDDYHLPRLSTTYALRVKAAALLLLGEQALALDTLDASFRAGDYLQWWYTLDRDSLWAPFRGTPRFEEMRARVRQHIDEQRSALASLRQQGLVPTYAFTRR